MAQATPCTLPQARGSAIAAAATSSLNTLIAFLSLAGGRARHTSARAWTELQRVMVSISSGLDCRKSQMEESRNVCIRQNIRLELLPLHMCYGKMYRGVLAVQLRIGIAREPR